jgi:hypothetical protein
MDDLSSNDMQRAERLGYLIAAHITKSLTIPEKEELEEWLSQSEANRLLFDRLVDEVKSGETSDLLASLDREAALQRVKLRISYLNSN